MRKSLFSCGALIRVVHEDAVVQVEEEHVEGGGEGLFSREMGREPMV